VTWNGAEKQSYTYDGLGRLTNRQLKPSASITLNHSYTYADAAGNKTTSLVETLTTAAGTYTYTYDAAGNILSISDGAYLLSYQYDGLNRLIRENDERAGKTYTYEYAQGNITKKKEYAYTTGTVSGTPLNVTEWEYGNAEWGDLLTNWNGQPLEYDSIGNLTAFGTEGAARRELFWNGRQLKSIRLGQGAAATNILYEYNSDGLRISRTTTDADGQAAVTKYIYNGDILAGEIRDDGKSLLFYYDNNGQPFGLRYNGTDYYYLRNLQNDVAAIADGTGAIAARYYYDAWGNLLSVTDGAGHAVTDAEHIGLVNPIRYRGYYYDSETGMYYVSSRYYNPKIGRWINADIPETLTADFENFAQYNLFAYCFNNPVNMSDETGTWPSWATKLVIGIGAVVVGAAVVAATAATGGAAAAFVGAAVAGLKTAAVSGAIGAVVGAGTRAVSHRVSTGGWSGAGKAAVDGAVDGFANGFMTGGIMAGGSQILSSGFKVAANAGVPTGRNGGLTIGNRVRVLSPNHPQAYEAGGTLLKIGSKYKNIRFDVGSNSLFHMNIQLAKTANYHLPIGMLGAGLWGGIARD